MGGRGLESWPAARTSKTTWCGYFNATFVTDHTLTLYMELAKLYLPLQGLPEGWMRIQNMRKKEMKKQRELQGDGMEPGRTISWDEGTHNCILGG
jgi:hypothetical protein